jgi:hypothetical protein
MPYDLFIFYSRRDNAQGRITQLVARIKQDFAAFAGRQLVSFFDQHEINGMEDWRQRILQGLRESRLLLACLSPAYLQSGYCEWEFIEYLKYEIGHLHGFNGGAPIYFVHVPGWDDPDFDQRCAAWIAELRRRQHFDLRPWHDQGEDALRETDVRERLTELNRQIADTILRGERAEKSLGNPSRRLRPRAARGTIRGLHRLGSRKEYDRNTAMETIRTIQALGCRIVKP